MGQELARRDRDNEALARRVARCLGAGLILVSIAPRDSRAGGGDSPRFFEYLNIEANSGGSSGGHAAICFGGSCYHFQQTENSMIRLRRDDFEELDYQYRLLGNRTVHASRIEVSSGTYDRLREAFDARLRVQDRQIEVLESLTGDRTLVQQLIEKRDESPWPFRKASVRVPGSGYFFDDQAPGRRPLFTGGGEPSETLADLASLVRQAYGDGFLERRSAELRAAIARLAPADDAPVPPPEAGKLPRFSAGFATQYRELLSALLAIEVLRWALPLRADTVLTAAGADLALQPAEIEALRGYALRIADALVQLPHSARPDWGYPMLVGMARLLAVTASIRSGQMCMLDTFAEDAQTVSWETVARHAEALALLRDEEREDFLAARHAFFSAGGASEARLSQMETAGALLLESERVLDRRSAIRVRSGPVVPAKSALRQDWPAPELSAASLERALTVTRHRERSYAVALSRLYPYDVVRRNCVTEIFREIDSALGPAASELDGRSASIREASIRLLGGYVDWRSKLNFIPFVSAKAVRGAYRVSQTAERPSYRRLALEQMHRSENALRVDLRESNVLTARSYARNEDDPAFLFFTDEVLLRRPLYGIANLTVGVGAMLAGLPYLPVGDGSKLRAGLDGVLFSVPELVFMNIRKGSLAFAPRRWTTDKAYVGLRFHTGKMEFDR